MLLPRLSFVLLLLLIFSVHWTSSPLAQGIFDQDPDSLTAQQLWTQYRAWRDEDRLVEAETFARQLLVKALQDQGEDSIEAGMALTELGITRLLMGRHDQALSDLRLAEDTLRERVPLYSDKLIGALTFLGSALQSAGRHDEALDAFTRGQHITHRLLGTGNFEQLRIVYAKADSYQALSQFDQAEELQRHAHKLHRIHHGELHQDSIAASARLGTWLRSVGDYHGALAHFHAALTELQGDGPDVPEAYPLLNGLAHAYRGGYRGKYARSTHQRIIALVSGHPEAFDLEQRVKAHLDYGDWLMQRYFEKPAVQQYEAAWKVADDAGNAGLDWVRRLASPRMVRYGEMTPYENGVPERQVRFKFNLTDDGRARRVKLVSHKADRKDSALARKQFPDLVRFRPAIIDGRAVAIPNQSATMFLLPEDVLLEPAVIEAPQRLTESGNANNPTQPPLDTP